MAYNFIIDYQCSCGKDFKKVTEKFEDTAICWCGSKAEHISFTEVGNYSTTNSNLTIIADIQPYKSMVTGEMITSRAKHRNHLRDHNLTEIGNEKVTTKPIEVAPGLRETIERAAYSTK